MIYLLYSYDIVKVNTHTERQMETDRYYMDHNLFGVNEKG